ncbi:uncharacterized protein LOC110011310 [Sesamum indicum]|uniref:Uncharacterized protein LOC110011310 n=1 Tax=Sesamum indicum TaxID=4182 RepID=A0A8M8USH4_SESIN|nr:uncharacterized protein LOC110011310 [Sesamum indicum]
MHTSLFIYIYIFPHSSQTTQNFPHHNHSIMCAKIPLLLLLSCFLTMHACNARPFAGATSISHKVEKNLKFNKNHSSNMKNTFWKRLNPMETKDLCQKNKGIERIKSGSEDCNNKSSDLHKGLLHPSISEASRWPHDLDVREMAIFKDEDLSKTDYQPPHRKSPIHNK